MEPKYFWSCIAIRIDLCPCLLFNASDLFKNQLSISATVTLFTLIKIASPFTIFHDCLENYNLNGDKVQNLTLSPSRFGRCFVMSKSWGRFRQIFLAFSENLNFRNMEILNATSEWLVPHFNTLDTQYFKVATTEISHASRSPDNVFHDLTP